MSSAAEALLGAIGTAKENQTTAAGALAQVAGALEAAQAAFAQSGGQDKIALLGAIAGKCQLAQGAAQEALTAIDEMLHLAGAVHGQTGLVPTAGGGYDIHPAARDPRGPPRGHKPSPPPSPAEARKQFFDAALTAEKIRELLSGLPIFGQDNTKTEGAWIDEDGKPRRITSGEHDAEYVAAREYWRTVANALMPKAGWDTDLWVSSHVEIKAAIQMFIRQRQHATVVINNPDGPCGGKPITCKEVLSKYLRRGQTLTVFWPENNSIIIEGTS